MTRTILLIAALCMGVVTDAHAALLITDDGGGNIGSYFSRFDDVRKAGEQVVIDGSCFSACTLVLGLVPRERICVTRKAVFGFHAAYRPGSLGTKVVNLPATRTLLNIYPGSIRHWISRRGGLRTEMIYLSGHELAAMYPLCK